MKRFLTGWILTAMLMVGTTFGKDGIIVLSAAETNTKNQCTEQPSTFGKKLMNFAAGIIVLSATGIIVLSAKQQKVECGIIVLS
ncbi:MAG: hypothetical protein LC734_09200 [Acidobacteria bacterium]|nr:hypothetical protein [Acidobacteriota bacterium]